jgi:hypothetical protein
MKLTGFKFGSGEVRFRYEGVMYDETIDEFSLVYHTDRGELEYPSRKCLSEDILHFLSQALPNIKGMAEEYWKEYDKLEFEFENKVIRYEE